MKTQKQKKAGFTLVELMVVAIIVAILAAVAIPLMSGNTERAVATEGQAGISTIATALRVTKAETGTMPASGSNATTLTGIQTGDLIGTYFNDGSYSWTANNAANTYQITAVVKASSPKFAGQSIMFDSATGKYYGLGQTDAIPAP